MYIASIYIYIYLSYIEHMHIYHTYTQYARLGKGHWSWEPCAYSKERRKEQDKKQNQTNCVGGYCG